MRTGEEILKHSHTLCMETLKATCNTKTSMYDMTMLLGAVVEELRHAESYIDEAIEEAGL